MYCKHCWVEYGIKRKMVKAGRHKTKTGIFQRYLCSGKDGCGHMIVGERLL